MRQKRVLVFSDFESIRNIIVKSLQSKDYDVIETKSYKEAQEELNGTSFSLVITDNDIKNKEGRKLVSLMRNGSSYLYTPILLLHSSKPEQLADQYTEYNIACYLNKPFDMQKFYNVVERFA